MHPTQNSDTNMNDEKQDSLKEWKAPTLTSLSQSKTSGKLFNTPGEVTTFSGS